MIALFCEFLGKMVSRFLVAAVQARQDWRAAGPPRTEALVIL